MSKAILVLDIFDTCVECPCFQGYDILNAYCGKTKKVIPFEEEKGFIKQDWCPLRKVPEKYDITFENADRDYDGEYEYGWNACLDEILGE